MKEIKIKHFGIEKTLNYRSESVSDFKIIQEVFLKKSYGLSSFKQSQSLTDYYNDYIEDGIVPIIIDAGANIGIASVWFSLIYQDAKVIAIEPERGNLKVLEKNVCGLEVKIIEGALGSTSGTMFLSDPGIGDWGFRVLLDGKGEAVKVFSGSEIMATVNSHNHFPFICKIDIEGGEDNLFSDNTDWIRSFPIMIIELHDWMLPGESNSRNFFKLIAENNYDVVHRGELIFAFNNELLKKD